MITIKNLLKKEDDLKLFLQETQKYIDTLKNDLMNRLIIHRINENRKESLQVEFTTKDVDKIL